MLRTQISLSGREYDAAKREARRLGISLAELLRRSLRAVRIRRSLARRRSEAPQP